MKKKTAWVAAVFCLVVSTAMAATELPRNSIVDDQPRTRAGHDQGWISFGNEDYVPLSIGLDGTYKVIQVRRYNGRHEGGYLLQPGQRITITFNHEVWHIEGADGRPLTVGAHKQRVTPVTFVGVQQGNRYATEALVRDGHHTTGAIVTDFHHRDPRYLPPAFTHGGEYSPPPPRRDGYNHGYNDGYNDGYQDADNDYYGIGQGGTYDPYYNQGNNNGGIGHGVTFDGGGNGGIGHGVTFDGGGNGGIGHGVTFDGGAQPLPYQYQPPIPQVPQQHMNPLIRR